MPFLLCHGNAVILFLAFSDVRRCCCYLSQVARTESSEPHGPSASGTKAFHQSLLGSLLPFQVLPIKKPFHWLHHVKRKCHTIVCSFLEVMPFQRVAALFKSMSFEISNTRPLSRVSLYLKTIFLSTSIKLWDKLNALVEDYRCGIRKRACF